MKPSKKTPERFICQHDLKCGQCGGDIGKLPLEIQNLKRAVGILVEYAKAGPHRGDDLAEDIENAKQFRKDSDWLSQFLTDEA